MSVVIDGNEARVTFERFDLTAYEVFLRCKAIPEKRLSVNQRTGAYSVATPVRFASMLEDLGQVLDGSAFIYALIDPRTNAIRYIGKSIRPIERMAAHQRDSSYTQRTNWLRDLAASGLKPILLLLDRVPVGEPWQERECEWIAYGRARGWPLTNSTDGGDGVINLPAEARARMAAVWKGRKHRPESIAKMAAASTGKIPTEASRAKRRQKLLGREITTHARALISDKVSKLTAEQVAQVRGLLATGMAQRAIAARFGVHQGTISNLKRGRFYRDAL